MSDNENKLGIAPNLAGLLCNTPCCIGLIFSVIAIVVEKENKFIKFHAFQSLLLHGAAFAVWIVLWLAGMIAGMILWILGLAVGALSLLIALGFLGAQIFMMIKANNNEQFKLPVIGDLASQWS